MNEQQYLEEVARLQQRNWPQGVSRTPSYPFGEVPLTEYLRRWAKVQPDKPAWIFYGREIGFAELDRLSDRFAALLAQHGVERGDRVAVFMPNCPQFLVAFYGILKRGAIHVPVNPLFKAAELLYELNDTDARAIVVLDQLMPLLREVKARTALQTVFASAISDMLPAEPTLPLPPGVGAAKVACPDAVDLMDALMAVTSAPPPDPADLDAVAALNYTGGTTGMPKGCVHTQRNMLYTAATGCTVAAPYREDDVGINFLPVFWIAGEDVALIFPIFTGNSYVVLARWDPLVDNIVEVLDHPDAGRYDFSSLRRARCSSFVKKLNPEYRRRWQALTGTVLAEAAWGMTETHTYDTFTSGMQEDDYDLKAQPIFVGLPMPGTEFKICDFETGELRPLGAEVEICVRTPSLLKGYWNKGEATEQALRKGWLHTGDIGVLDTDGYLHFLGRRKEMLKVNGMCVFPAEIEALLGQHPAIVGSGVVGRDDDRRGQVPVAFVLLGSQHRTAVNADDLVAWCRDTMATYKVPEIRIVEALPMTATGKVKKNELAQLL
jgi:long-chain acyl-CoA synthetase